MRGQGKEDWEHYEIRVGSGVHGGEGCFLKVSCMGDGAGWLAAESGSGNKESNAGQLGETRL